MEALAAGEAEGDGECIGSGSIVCPLIILKYHMYIFIIACLVSLITFSSCQQEVQKPNSVYVNFPQTVKLKARVISQDSVMFRYPFRIHIREDKAVVMDLHATEYFFMLLVILIFTI